MNAWIDCMTSLDAPEDGMTSVHVPEGHALALQLEHVDDFARRCPEQYGAIIECAAFVNWRRIEQGQPAVLAPGVLQAGTRKYEPRTEVLLPSRLMLGKNDTG